MLDENGKNGAASAPSGIRGVFVSLSGRSSTSKACSGSQRQPGTFRGRGPKLHTEPGNSRRRGGSTPIDGASSCLPCESGGARALGPVGEGGIAPLRICNWRSASYQSTSADPIGRPRSFPDQVGQSRDLLAIKSAHVSVHAITLPPLRGVRAFRDCAYLPREPF